MAEGAVCSERLSAINSGYKKNTGKFLNFDSVGSEGNASLSLCTRDIYLPL